MTKFEGITWRMVQAAVTIFFDLCYYYFLYGTEMLPQLMKLILRSEMLHYICFVFSDASSQILILDPNGSIQ